MPVIFEPDKNEKGKWKKCMNCNNRINAVKNAHGLCSVCYLKSDIHRKCVLEYQKTDKGKEAIIRYRNKMVEKRKDETKKLDDMNEPKEPKGNE